MNILLIFFTFSILITNVAAYYSFYLSSFLKSSKLNARKYHVIDGIKCKKCEGAVLGILRRYDPEATISSKNKVIIKTDISIDELNIALINVGQYSIRYEHSTPQYILEQIIKFSSLLGVIASIILLTALLQLFFPISFTMASITRDFMGTYFIVFSIFKMTNMYGFVKSFQTYDLLAQMIPLYSWLYPFIEMTIGIIYLIFRDSTKITARKPLYMTNLFTAIIMSISSISVYKSIMQGRSIQCACLGSWFNLPMTYVSLIESASMAIMAIHNILTFK